MFNRIVPEAFYILASAYYDFDDDPALRAAVLFGHSENFSRRNDVDAFSALTSISAELSSPDMIFAETPNLWAISAGRRDPNWVF